jgi:nitrogen fixation NifU-like protein
MNTDANNLQEIYRHRVLEHSKHPHNFRHMANANHEAVGFNPLCGDKITVYLQLDDNRISDITFEGSGCAISVASASMMTEAIRGRSAAEADELITTAQNIFTTGASADNKALAELEALAGVSKYRSRIKCASLAWSTATAALSGINKQVTTEG